LRAKNAGISGLNRTTHAESSTSTWYAFAGQVNMDVARRVDGLVFRCQLSCDTCSCAQIE
jgi:hypothetical protein